MRVTVPRPSTAAAQLCRSLRGTMSSPRLVVAAAGLTAVIFSVFVLSTFPSYTLQLLGADVGYVGAALAALTTNLYASIGALGVGLTVVYSALTAVVLLHLSIQVQTAGLSASFGGASGAVPVFLIGGCAGCGAGVVGLLGAAGALALLPFNGNGVRLLGVVFLLGFLAYQGDPRTCTLD
ncbi:MAG: hypothetical protein SVU88_00465 [Candidatus Nanohaloarchaea archaeon]|nr:hypothetical protein [Candidatus Nanohaloarchaea archaeon]